MLAHHKSGSSSAGARMGNLAVLQTISGFWFGLAGGVFLGWLWTRTVAFRTAARKDEQIANLSQLLAEQKATNDEAIAMNERWQPKRDSRGQFLKP